MSVNGSSFQNITHTAAVNLLSNSHRNSQLMVTFKRVGRIPYSPDRVPCNGDLSRVTPLADNLQEVNMVTEKVHLSRTILGHHIDWKTFICVPIPNIFPPVRLPSLSLLYCLAELIILSIISN